MARVADPSHQLGVAGRLDAGEEEGGVRVVRAQQAQQAWGPDGVGAPSKVRATVRAGIPAVCTLPPAMRTTGFPVSAAFGMGLVQGRRVGWEATSLVVQPSKTSAAATAETTTISSSQWPRGSGRCACLLTSGRPGR
ncbi:hypothetical protein SANT12839_042930 [Streptomyces antimycoticus]|uniref:Uncharacterized protein n=1 Tax=Streptomyces antimycoticus TaxID=68175 RepID=A0A4D4K2U6_9ACTN|nr:hypothetical protein SANT12839_042930 [Streptomyces antimycoticus]